MKLVRVGSYLEDSSARVSGPQASSSQTGQSFGPPGQFKANGSEFGVDWAADLDPYFWRNPSPKFARVIASKSIPFEDFLAI